jgi:hypothetical protein
VRKNPPRTINMTDDAGRSNPQIRAKGQNCCVSVAGQCYVTGTSLFIKVMAQFAYWLTAALERPLNRASDRPDLATKHVILRSP